MKDNSGHIIFTYILIGAVTISMLVMGFIAYGGDTLVTFAVDESEDTGFPYKEEVKESTGGRTKLVISGDLDTVIYDEDVDSWYKEYIYTQIKLAEDGLNGEPKKIEGVYKIFDEEGHITKRVNTRSTDIDPYIQYITNDNGLINNKINGASIGNDVLESDGSYTGINEEEGYSYKYYENYLKIEYIDGRVIEYINPKNDPYTPLIIDSFKKMYGEFPFYQ